MNTQAMLNHESIRELIGLLISQRHIRSEVLRIVDAKAHQTLVEDNRDGRPPRVQEDKHEYLMALLSGFDRAIERGSISKHVTKRFLEVFVGNMLLGKEQDEAARSLGFYPPYFLLVSPTGKCNLRCTGCYAASDSRDHASLDWQTFDRILTEKRELWGSHFTVISGGEPFLWHDGRRRLLDMVAKHPCELFMVYTNATLITDDVAKRMGELGNVTPAISVEGFEEETDARRGQSVYRRILNAFENLRRHGVPFGVSVTATNSNWETATSERFADFYFEQEGAVYGWLFQYMPIGRSQALDRMVSPPQRVEMLRRMRRLVRERKVFLADFWNSGTASAGCICAGRPGGYFYIDWNGDISPCAFVPFAKDNIYRIYSAGGTINSALNSPLFKYIREWQDQYGYAQPSEKAGNWLCPCVIRDHFDILKDAVSLSGAAPINEEAALAIKDAAYCRSMRRYGKDLEVLADPIWAEEYACRPVAAQEKRLPEGS